MKFEFNKYVGIPYQRLDCWGLVDLVCFDLGLELPNLVSPDDSEESRWEKVTEIESGDILTFERDGIVFHVGIAISGRKFLHSTEEVGAVIEDIFDGYWDSRMAGVYRYV